MTSQIDPALIDSTYPLARRNQPSQGFRDNFDKIKDNFAITRNEITELQGLINDTVTTTTNTWSSEKINAAVNAITQPVFVLAGTSTITSTLSAQPNLDEQAAVNNFFVGSNAGAATTTGYNNTFIGEDAGRENTEGTDNIFMGMWSGRENTTGNYNNFLGSYAGSSNISGQSNNFLGYNGYSNTTGSNNNFLGWDAGSSNTTGSDNNFLGWRSGFYNTAGSCNNFIGAGAGYNNTTGNYNNIIGADAGGLIAQGSFNNLFGSRAGFWLYSGTNNNLFGYNAGADISTGSNNTIIGELTGSANLADTVLIGAGTTERIKVDSTGLYINGTPFTIDQALVVDPTLRNIHSATNSLTSITTGVDNVAIGYNTGLSTTVGLSNIFLGTGAGFSNVDGEFNTCIGEASGYFNTSGDSNIFIGVQSGWNNTTGSINTFIGDNAGRWSNGDQNTFIGCNAGISVATGNNNTIIGGVPGTADLADTVLIGAGAIERIKVDATGLYINQSKINSVNEATQSYSGYFPGTTTSTIGTIRKYMSTTYTITKISVWASNNVPTPTTVTIKKNGTSIGAATISTGAMSGNSGTVSLIVTPTDYITVDLTSTGAENVGMRVDYQ